MAKQYGTVKVDFIACTSGTAGNETDVVIDVSGLSSISQSGITLTGDIIANDITATGTLSGATITGAILKATSITGVTGVFTTLLSGASITGELISGTSGVFTNVTGTTINSVTGSFTDLTVTNTITGDITGTSATATTATNCSRSVVAGSGLTGGGELNANRTVNVGAGDGISVAADAVAVDSTVVRTTGNQTIGGTKTFSSTIAGSINGNAATATSATTATTATNCSRSVVAGSGLAGGGELNADRTVTVGAGDGISVAADAVAVDSTVVRTTGNQTIGGTKTFSSTIVGSINGNAATATNADTLDGLGSTQFLRSDVFDSKTSGSLRFNDSVQLQLGSDGDVSFFYNNADLYLDLNTAGDSFNLRNDTDALLFKVDSAGNCINTGNILPATDSTGNIGTGTFTWANGRFVNFRVDSTLLVRGALDLGDSDILRFGNDDDVEFFFNGTNFYLDLNSGGNNFIIRDGTTTRFTFDDDGDLIATRTLVAQNFKETVFTISWSAGFALNPLNGETQFVVLGGNSTPTQSNWDNGESITLHIDDGSSYTITWTTLGVVWTGGSAPTLATTGDTVVQLWKAGNVIYGALVGEVA